MPAPFNIGSLNLMQRHFIAEKLADAPDSRGDVWIDLPTDATGPQNFLRAPHIGEGYWIAAYTKGVSPRQIKDWMGT